MTRGSSLTKMKKIVGFVGNIGCGKDTAADVLCDNGFIRDSFASSLKDITASVFGWDRTMVDGRTSESRVWREQVDKWWAERLNIPNFTPRYALQYLGTDCIRNKLHNDVWVATVEHRFTTGAGNVVISDVRFPNEMAAINRMGGMIVRIQRGLEPPWAPIAVAANTGDAVSAKQMQALGIHESEWAWMGQPVHATIFNDGGIDDFRKAVKNIVLGE